MYKYNFIIVILGLESYSFRKSLVVFLYLVIYNSTLVPVLDVMIILGQLAWTNPI